jgi:hypothetical protein
MRAIMSKPYFIESTPKSYLHPKSDYGPQSNIAINLSNVVGVDKQYGDTGVWVIYFSTINAHLDVAWGYTSESARDKDYEKIVNGVYE